MHSVMPFLCQTFLSLYTGSLRFWVFFWLICLWFLLALSAEIAGENLLGFWKFGFSWHFVINPFITPAIFPGFGSGSNVWCCGSLGRVPGPSLSKFPHLHTPPGLCFITATPGSWADLQMLPFSWVFTVICMCCNVDRPSERQDTLLYGFLLVLILRPNFSMDWAAKGIHHYATQAHQVSHVAYFFFKVFLSCNAKVSQQTKMHC